ncbi:MAG: hypothetical protein GY730_01360 [bacterium]|nr:hypothetical protein [bacterium]
MLNSINNINVNKKNYKINTIKRKSNSSPDLMSIKDNNLPENRITPENASKSTFELKNTTTDQQIFGIKNNLSKSAFCLFSLKINNKPDKSNKKIYHTNSTKSLDYHKTLSDNAQKKAPSNSAFINILFKETEVPASKKGRQSILMLLNSNALNLFNKTRPPVLKHEKTPSIIKRYNSNKILSLKKEKAHIINNDSLKGKELLFLKLETLRLLNDTFNQCSSSFKNTAFEPNKIISVLFTINSFATFGMSRLVLDLPYSFFKLLHYHKSMVKRKKPNINNKKSFILALARTTKHCLQLSVKIIFTPVIFPFSILNSFICLATDKAGYAKYKHFKLIGKKSTMEAMGITDKDIELLRLNTKIQKLEMQTPDHNHLMLQVPKKKVQKSDTLF